MTKTKQIVIAWADQTALIPTGRHVMRDMNWFPEFKADWEGKACMWRAKGTDADIEKASNHAKSEGHTVFLFPSTERDPLGKAKTMAVQAARKAA